MDSEKKTLSDCLEDSDGFNNKVFGLWSDFMALEYLQWE